jgi:hypothetical protein
MSNADLFWQGTVHLTDALDLSQPPSWLRAMELRRQCRITRTRTNDFHVADVRDLREISEGITYDYGNLVEHLESEIISGQDLLLITDNLGECWQDDLIGWVFSLIDMMQRIEYAFPSRSIKLLLCLKAISTASR